MSGHFESAAWLAATAAMVGAEDSEALAAALASAVDVAVEHEGTALIAFHRDAQPEVIHHTLEPAGRRHYLERYLDGPYLLDPLYDLAGHCTRPALCRFREALPDRFRSSEYYRRYCERTHLQDEMDFLTPVASSTTVVLVVGRRTRRFTKSELGRLRRMAPLVHACVERLWSSRSGDAGAARRRDDVHRRLSHCFERFGRDTLTERERQISQLLLRGHSTKSVARALGIAPGTVMVHKRNLFAKLGISSQFELFAMLIDDLGQG